MRSPALLLLLLAIFALGFYLWQSRSSGLDVTPAAREQIEKAKRK